MIRDNLLISNVNVYRDIAREALDEGLQLAEEAETPKPGGEPGFIIRYDPSQKSFKKCLVSIVFSGVYLEALLYLCGCKLLGKTQYLKIEKYPYELKLRCFGVKDSGLLTDCERFKKARNDLVHEKATTKISVGKMRYAQTEAVFAVATVEKISDALQNIINLRASA